MILMPAWTPIEKDCHWLFDFVCFYVQFERLLLSIVRSSISFLGAKFELSDLK
jgi:hypothetical protein